MYYSLLCLADCSKGVCKKAINKKYFSAVSLSSMLRKLSKLIEKASVKDSLFSVAALVSLVILWLISSWYSFGDREHFFCCLSNCQLQAKVIEYRSDDVTKIIFLKLWDMMA